MRTDTTLKFVVEQAHICTVVFIEINLFCCPRDPKC